MNRLGTRILMSALGVALLVIPVPRTNASSITAGTWRPLSSSSEDNSPNAIRVVSFLQLLVHPELYDGATIRVSGYLLFDYPDARLFISRDDRTALGAFFGAVSINFRGAKIPVDYDRLRANAARGYFIVRGRFSAKDPERATIDQLQDYYFALDGPDPKRQ